MPASYPRYPSRQQMVEYLEAYRAHFSLEPSYGRSVTANRARAETAGSVSGGDDQITTDNVVVATGNTRVPFRPTWPGEGALPCDDPAQLAIPERCGFPWQARAC